MKVNNSFLNKGPIGGCIRDLVIAGGFLTCLPFRPSEPVSIADLGPAVRMFPIIGLIVGILGGIALLLAAQVNLNSIAYGVIGLALVTVITGALHEDGLADFMDGVGASERLRRLEIMRDPSIGAFGVLALIFSIGLKIGLIAGLPTPNLAASALVLAAIISRGMIPFLMYFMKPAQTDGLGHDSGRPTAGGTGIALIVSAVAAIIVLDVEAAIFALFLSAAVVSVVGWFAYRRLAGYTGDVLGAAQQCSEIAVLVAVGVDAL